MLEEGSMYIMQDQKVQNGVGVLPTPTRFSSLSIITTFLLCPRDVVYIYKYWNICILVTDLA